MLKDKMAHPFKNFKEVTKNIHHEIPMDVVRNREKLINALKTKLREAAFGVKPSAREKLCDMEIDLGHSRAGDIDEDAWKLETDLKEDYLKVLENDDAIKKFEIVNTEDKWA